MSTGPGGCPLVAVVKFYGECTENHVWGPLGVRDMSIFVKHVFLQSSLPVITVVEKSVKNCIGWCSQIAKRMNFRSYCDHIIIL